MNKNVIINKFEYKVERDEFNRIIHSEFNNLHILENLGLYEILISLIRELKLIYYTTPDISFYNVTHGGFIPINCADIFENVFIINSDKEHIQNIITNIRLKSVRNISIIEDIFLTDVIFIDNLSKIKDLEYKNSVILTNDLRDILEFKYKFKVANIDYILYIPECLYENFYKEFYYFIKDNELNYDNLINMTMIVKNAGDNFENILKENLNIIDRWTILDTGSTDNTIEIINKVLVGKKKGNLYQEDFINFRDSRNKCLDLAGESCKFCIMLDDTYIVKENLREFLNIVRGDQFSDSFSLFVKSNDTIYNSNRIIKSKSKLRYIHKIHEVITPINNSNVIIPLKNSYIFDYRCEYMENRTINRKEYDLKILFDEYEENTKDPRNLYYIAQTYNILKKYDLAYEYYIKRTEHPEQGFIQEKIDSCFEAARIANFKLNKKWEECERLYLKSYDMDTTRSDALYFIGIHYYLENKYEIAYNYMKKCYLLGYPEHCQYSLKPSLHFYFLPKFLAHLCYIFEDYQTGFNCCKLFLEKTKISKDGHIPFKECYNSNDVITMKSWFDIFNFLIYIPDINTNFMFNSRKPYLVFMADGGFNNWTGKDILTEGMGGSETFVIEITKYIQLQNFFQVVVFCRCNNNDVFEGVEYRKLEEYFPFIYSNIVHTCIIGRYSEYLPITIKSKVENIYMISHDLEFTGNVIPQHPKLKKIFCLSKWHTEYFTSIFPTIKNIVEPFGYGINKDLFNIPVQKDDKLHFIYSSFPNRGLLPLLQMWPKILNKYNNAVLHIHSDINGSWSNKMKPVEMNMIKDLLILYKKNNDLDNSIIYHGWTSKVNLCKSWVKADICFYPCTFRETFCHTVLEAAFSKTLIITTKLAALEENVSDRGILFDGNFYDENFQEETLPKIFKIIDNKKLCDELINKNYEWVKNNTWEQRSLELLKIIL
jgi:hypothetical protein